MATIGMQLPYPLLVLICILTVCCGKEHVTCYRCSETDKVCKVRKCLGTTCFKYENKIKGKWMTETGCLSRKMVEECKSEVVFGEKGGVRCYCNSDECNFSLRICPSPLTLSVSVFALLALLADSVILL